MSAGSVRAVSRPGAGHPQRSLTSPARPGRESNDQAYQQCCGRRAPGGGPRPRSVKVVEVFPRVVVPFRRGRLAVRVVSLRRACGNTLESVDDASHVTSGRIEPRDVRRWPDPQRARSRRTLGGASLRTPMHLFRCGTSSAPWRLLPARLRACGLLVSQEVDALTLCADDDKGGSRKRPPVGHPRPHDLARVGVAVHDRLVRGVASASAMLASIEVGRKPR